MKIIASIKQQQGLSLSSLLLWAVLIVFSAIVGMKVIPAYVENKTIQRALDDIAHDSEMQTAQAHDIQNAFYKRTVVDNVTSVSGEDIIIDKRPTGLVLSANYQVKIPLAGNISLLLEFNVSSAHPR